MSFGINRGLSPITLTDLIRLLIRRIPFIRTLQISKKLELLPAYMGICDESGDNLCSSPTWGYTGEFHEVRIGVLRCDNFRLCNDLTDCAWGSGYLHGECSERRMR